MVEICNAAEKSIRSMDKLDSHAIERVKAHTLTYVPLNNIQTRFTCVSHGTELIKTIIDSMLSLELSTRPRILFRSRTICVKS